MSMIGSGYVALISGTRLADFGRRVVRTCKYAGSIDVLKDHGIPIFESASDQLLVSSCGSGRRTYAKCSTQAAGNDDIAIIAVGTQSRRQDEQFDISFFYAAAEKITDDEKDFTALEPKRTEPVGTGDEVGRLVCQAGGRKAICNILPTEACDFTLPLQMRRFSTPLLASYPR